MAALYGRLQGARGEVTRTGHDHIRAQVETWEGIVRVEMTRDGDYRVVTSGKHGERLRCVLAGNVNRDEIAPAFRPGEYHDADL